MSDKTLRVRIVTPEAVTWEGDATSVVVPAAEGQLGVLPGHAPLLAQLAPGVVRVSTRDEEPRVLSVSGGFLEVERNIASLFAETAELAEDVDAERARLAAERARASMTRGADADLEKSELALKVALARLRAAELVRRRSGGQRGGR